ncbi:hypothetical protein DFH11DRAFT_1206182 [Phellopilus nigrolimitatus]|nr:hypothetical protein DFH11DRAFT_1206182 [Phellopilus nigrolimitatus]
MPFDSSRVPNEIWFKIAQFSDLKEAMHLETTCKFLRGVISNKTFWLERLHALDQDRAPNLPRHVRLNELDFSDLRILVERAHRRRFNCTAPTLLRPTRKITVPIRPEDSDDPCGGPYGFGRGDVALLPGGALLLVLWSSGYLQCWDVQGGERVWVYPQRASSDVLDMQMPKVCEFSYDMQADGNVHVLVVSESTDNRTSER